MLNRNKRIRSWMGASLLGLIVALGALASRPAAAVEQTGDLTGVVRDEKAEVLPGATITLKGDNFLGERSTTTDTKGEFNFRSLPPGKYSVKITFTGYQAIEHDGVTVNIGRTTTLPISLTKGELSETVSVIGRAPLVDPIRTTTQDNYGTDYLEKVQIGSNGRSYQSVIANSAGTGPGDGANPTVRGSTDAGNVYLVDGVDSTDPVTNTFGTNFVYNAIQEVQFQTGGFNAEFGRATGGIVNVVTKSGGNAFSGSFDARYRDENFYEKGDHFDPDAFDIKRRIFEGTLGGPILKDKIWFFLAGGYTRSDFAGQGYNSVFGFKGKQYLGKLTWQANQSNKFILQLTGDPAVIDNSNASPLVALEAGSKQTQGSKFITAQYEGILSPSVIVNAQVARYKSELDSEPQNGDFSTIGFVNFFTGAQSRNYNDAQYSDRFRDQLQAALTWNVDEFAGSHTFKFGTDQQRIKFKYNQFTPGGEYDQVCTPADGCPGNPSILLYFVDHPAGELENKGHVGAYYAQDEWRVLPRLTFNLGLRYETFAYDNNLGDEVFDAHLLQPRAGIAWDITGDSRNVWKVFGGRFGDASLVSLPRVVNSRANATDEFVNENFFGDVNGDMVIEDRAFFTTFGGPGGSVFAHNGHLNATSVVEYQTSYERRLNDTSAIQLTFVRRRTYNIIEDRLDPRTGVYVIDNLGQADRNYYGAELRYRTQWKKLFLSASYNWSRSRGNVEDTQSLGTDFDFPVLSMNRYGYLSDDARHVVKINGYYDLPAQFRIGYSYNYNSGFAWTTVRSTFPYGVKFLEQRGSQRFPDQHQLDIDLSKGFTIGKTTLRAYFSIINALDTEIVNAVNANDGQNGQAIGYQSPRRYEIGGSFQF